MDIVLERILSLLPHKPDGAFLRGGKKELAEKIGIDKNIISQWISGTNKSYTKYVYQIADAYNVSVAWIMGETDNPMLKEDDAGNADVVELIRAAAGQMTQEDIIKSMHILTDALDKKREK